MNSTIETIEATLREKLKPEVLRVEDDSAKHRGHAGARQGGGHYIVTLVAPAFEGLGLVDQHRLVNEALKDLFGRDIHALALNTYSPTQWKSSGRP
ncbi:MAG: BolA family transcriptional regulator [Deltaproteobacteria bacterium]|nr:BolA family transcriptional regulator [Deltaproteobacteria bacterium]